MSVKVYGYARVTHAEQELGSSGLAIQKTAIEKYCAEKCYELVSIYEDTQEDCPNRTKMLEDLKSRKDKIKGVVVLSTSRIFENLNSIFYTYAQILKYKAELFSVCQPDVILANKKFQQGVQELLSMWKHDEFVNRMEAGKAKAREEREELATLQRAKPNRPSTNPLLFL